MFLFASYALTDLDRCHGFSNLVFMSHCSFFALCDLPVCVVMCCMLTLCVLFSFSFCGTFLYHSVIVVIIELYSPTQCPMDSDELVAVTFGCVG